MRELFIAWELARRLMDTAAGRGGGDGDGDEVG